MNFVRSMPAPQLRNVLEMLLWLWIIPANYLTLIKQFSRLWNTF